MVALEVTDLETTKRRSTASFFNGSKPQYPRRMFCIQGSDAHRITGNRTNLGVGERATELLLPEVSFKALKELFQSNDFSRVRPYRRATEEPYDHAQAARDQGSTIVQSFHEQMTRQGGRLHAVVRDVVAFANTNGGTIWVGLSPMPRSRPRGWMPGRKYQRAAHRDRTAGDAADRDRGAQPHQPGQEYLAYQRAQGGPNPYVLEGSKIYLRQRGRRARPCATRSWL